MTNLTKLADALENIAHMEYPSGHHDGNNLREAARILRAAAGADVAGLMDVSDRYALAQADPAHWRSALESDLRLALAAKEQAQPKENDAPKLWLWQNFVNGRPEYWAFDNPYPINLTDGDPQTLGEPCGYAIFKPSRQGRFDVSEERVLAAIARAAAAPKGTYPQEDRSREPPCHACGLGYKCRSANCPNTTPDPMTGPHRKEHHDQS